MEHVTFEASGSDSTPQTLVRDRLTDELGASDTAINHYQVPPGERLAGLHAHDDQEEVFVCLDGTMTFETLDGEYTVGAGEIVRFGPGEFQSGKNDADTIASVLAIGVPRDGTAIRVPIGCSSCGHDRTEPRVEDAGPRLVCPECGHESTVECPDCGSDDVRAELVAGDPMSVCQDCGNVWTVR